MTKTSALTAKAIERTKPGNVRREIPDGGCAGLFLVVQPSGAKSWALRFRSPIERDEDGQRKAKKLTLGTFTDKASDAKPAIGHPLTVGQAHMLATSVKEDIRRGIDPTAIRREEKAAAKVEAMTDNTVDAAMVGFLKRYKGKKRQGLRDSTRLLTAHYLGLKPDPEKPGEWLKRTNGGVLKKWSGRSLTSITKRDAIVVLDKLVDAGNGVTANRTLTNLKTFFTWAVKQDMLIASPVATLDAVASEVSRERILSDLELTAAWKVATAWVADPKNKNDNFGRLVQLLILLGQRRDEIREATRIEFALDGAAVAIDGGTPWHGPLWTLPAKRAKNGREHLIPLSEKAVEILKSCSKVKGSGYFLTTTGTTPISGLSGAKKRFDKEMQAELRKADPAYVLAPWTPHDLRRTFSSGLQRLGFPIEVIEECLNHKSGTRSGVAGVYAKYRYLSEKTRAFEAWARHVDALANGRLTNNVVPFREAVQ
jgi:integrase